MHRVVVVVPLKPQVSHLPAQQLHNTPLRTRSHTHPLPTLLLLLLQALSLAHRRVDWRWQ